LMSLAAWKLLKAATTGFVGLFMALIPLVGPIFLLVALATDGEQISNRFGQPVK
jgi:hypothetical protein